MSQSSTTISARPWWTLTLFLTCAALALPSPTSGADARSALQKHQTPPSSARPGSQARSKLCPCPSKTVKPAPSSKAALERKQARAMQRLAGTAVQPAPQMSTRLRQQAWLLRRWARYQTALADPALAGRHSKPQVLDGWQVRLVDGDTFAYGAERIRIRGIDTPEKSESGGFDASQRLDLLLREGPIVILPEAVDKYGRVVADVYINGRNVAEVLRSEGYAKPRP